MSRASRARTAPMLMSEARPAPARARAPVWIWWLVAGGALFVVIPLAVIVAISIFGTRVGGMFGRASAVLPGAHATEGGPVAVGRLVPTQNVDGVEVIEPLEGADAGASGDARLVDAFHAFARAHAGAAPRALDELLATHGADGAPYLEDASELLDLWGRPYVYARRETPSGWSVSLSTFGRDGRTGGEGLDADLVVLEVALPRE